LNSATTEDYIQHKKQGIGDLILPELWRIAGPARPWSAWAADSGSASWAAGRVGTGNCSRCHSADPVSAACRWRWNHCAGGHCASSDGDVIANADGDAAAAHRRPHRRW